MADTSFKIEEILEIVAENAEVLREIADDYGDIKDASDTAKGATGDFSAALNQVKAAGAGLKNIGDDITSIGTKMMTTGAGILGAAGGVTVLTGIAMSAWALEASGGLDKMHRSLKTITDDAAEASRMLEGFQDYALSTPFSLDVVMGTGTALASTGLRDAGLKDALDVASDMAASYAGVMGISFDDALKMVGPNIAKGMSGELGELTTFFPGLDKEAWAEVAKNGGPADLAAELKRQLEDANIAGMADEMGATFEAKFSNLIGKLQLGAANLMTPVLDYVVKLLDELDKMGIVDDLLLAFEPLQEALMIIVGTAGDFIKRLVQTGQLRTIVESLAKVFIITAEAFAWFAVNILPTLVNWFEVLAPYIPAIVIGLGAALIVGGAIVAVFGQILAAVGSVITVIAGLVVSIGGIISSPVILIIGVWALLTVWNAVAAAVTFIIHLVGVLAVAFGPLIALGIAMWVAWEENLFGFRDAVMNVWDFFRGLFITLKDWGAEVWGSIRDWGVQAWADIAAALEPVFSAVMKLGNAIRQSVIAAIQDLLGLVGDVYDMLPDAVKSTLGDIGDSMRNMRDLGKQTRLGGVAQGEAALPGVGNYGATSGTASISIPDLAGIGGSPGGGGGSGGGGGGGSSGPGVTNQYFTINAKELIGIRELIEALTGMPIDDEKLGEAMSKLIAREAGVEPG